MAKPISQINTDRDPRLFHPSYSSANLLHWLVSFCTSSACEQINLLRETSRLIPSKGLGTLDVEAHKRAGQWHLDLLEFEKDDSSIWINLLPAETALPTVTQ
jgi:hypothetical protein